MFDQGRRRAEAGESTAYDDRVNSHPNADRCDLAQICSAMRARTSFGTRTRSLNTS